MMANEAIMHNFFIMNAIFWVQRYKKKQKYSDSTPFFVTLQIKAIKST
jgi:hypothetical protein